MPFNPNDYAPVLNNWFETELKYEGTGYAEFTNPAGWVKGNAIVEVEETGEFSVVIEVKEFECEETLGLKNRAGDLDWLLSGIKPDILGGNPIAPALHGWPKNSCSRFKIATDEGIFSAIDDEIRYQKTFNMDADTVKFYPHVACFDSNEKKVPEFWALPISNFAESLHQYPPYVGSHPIFTHPLRFFSPPHIPEELDEHERQTAYIVANGQNTLVSFEYEGKLAFIEPLPDFSNRRDRLKAAETDNLVTAVIVGPVGNHTLEWPAAMDWLPIDSIHLLSLSTGSLIGIPWIEFQTGGGLLQRRIHLTGLWQTNYQEGHRALNLGLIGTLISNSPEDMPAYLRVAIRQLVKGGRKGLGTEDNFSHIVRAIDMLTEPIKTQAYNPSTFDQGRWEQVKNLLRDTGNQISAMADKATTDGNLDEANNERIVSQRVRGAANLGQRLGFPEAMSSLMNQLNIPDGQIMERYYQTCPRSDGLSSLEQVVSVYRGRIIHDGYFIFSDGTHSIRDITTVQNHLYDIALRSILKLLNFNGKYNSLVVAGDVPVDWVTLSTSASELGY